MIGLLTADSTALDVLTRVVSNKISDKLFVEIYGIDFKKPDTDGMVYFEVRAYDKVDRFRAVRIKGYIGSIGNVVITQTPAGVFTEV